MTHVPYLEISPWTFGPLTIRPFPAMMVSGILIAHFLMIRRAARLGLDARMMANLTVTMAAAGIAGAALFKALYDPAQFWLSLTDMLGRQVALASFGGILGGLAGAYGFFALQRTPRASAMRYVDAVAFCFPVGWILGRAGCFAVHDHPGIRSDSWLAVAYPGGARFDLAFLEILAVAVIIGLFHLLDRRVRPAGFYLAAFLALYGTFRVWLDQFHVDPPRYYGFSVDQWAGALAALAGISLLGWLLLSPSLNSGSAGKRQQKEEETLCGA